MKKIPRRELSGKTFKAIINELHKINPSFDNRSEFCIFYNSRSADHCSIYDHRPVQCKCYPYDYPTFSKIEIPPQLCDQYGCQDDDEKELPLCPPDAYQGDPHQKVIITEEQQKYVTQEKANYLAMTVSQEMLEEDISDVPFRTLS